MEKVFSVPSDSPWLPLYRRAGISAELVYDGSTVIDLFRETVRRNPNGIALILYTGKLDMKMTNLELWRLSDRFANGLVHRELIKQGDRVAIHLPNIPQLLIAYLAVLKCGGVVTCTFPRAPDNECQYKWSDSKVSLIITLDTLLLKDLEIAMQLPGPPSVIATHVSDCFSGLKKFLISKVLKKRGAWADICRWMSIDPPAVFEWEDIARARGGTPRHFSSNELALLIYTGGTTGGKPKAAMLTHENLAVNALQITTLFTDFRRDGEMITGFLPYYHSFGVTVCLNMALVTGTTILLIPRPYDEVEVGGETVKRYTPILRAIDKYRPTLLPSSPFLFEAFLDDPDFSLFDLGSIRYCVSGAAPLNEGLQNRFEEASRINIFEGYGLSEACSAVTTNSPEIRDLLDRQGMRGSTGVGLPVLGTEVLILDETDNRLPISEVGEVCIRGPQVMQGYLNKPDTTQGTIKEGVLHTGDMGYLDERGFLHLTGRKKYMILSSDGRNIYPEEIEGVLQDHPHVADVAVIKITDERRGEVPKALVVLKRGVSENQGTIDALIAYCRERLDYKYPRQISFRDEIPKSPDGSKILRGQLEEEELNQ